MAVKSGNLVAALWPVAAGVWQCFSGHDPAGAAVQPQRRTSDDYAPGAGNHRHHGNLRVRHQQPQLLCQEHPIQRAVCQRDQQHPYLFRSVRRDDPVCLPSAANAEPGPAGTERHAVHSGEPVCPVPSGPGLHRHDQPEISRPEAPDFRAAGGNRPGCSQPVAGRNGRGHQSLRSPEQNRQFHFGHPAHRKKSELPEAQH